MNKTLTSLLAVGVAGIAITTQAEPRHDRGHMSPTKHAQHAAIDLGIGAAEHAVHGILNNLLGTPTTVVATPATTVVATPAAVVTPAQTVVVEQPAPAVVVAQPVAPVMVTPPPPPHVYHGRGPAYRGPMMPSCPRGPMMPSR